MGVRGAKSWEGGGGFKVIIHHIGKRWGQFSSWGGGLTHPDKIKPQAKYCCILVFMLYYIIYIIYIYIIYIIILYYIYYIIYIILYYIILYILYIAYYYII